MPNKVPYRVPRLTITPGKDRTVNDLYLQRWLNEYAVQYEDDGTSLILPGSLAVTGGVDMGWYAVNPSSADGPEDWPTGFTLSNLSAASNWPVSYGTVETYADVVDNRAWQVCRPATGGHQFVRYYATDSTWSSWNMVESRVKESSRGSQYAIATASTYETMLTVTVSDLPSASFDARISVVASAWSQNTTAQRIDRLRVGISRNGSTYTYSADEGLGEHSAGFQIPLTAMFLVEGSVTGNILVRVQGFSNHADTVYEDVHALVTIGPNY